jgi:hypothetical protein
MSHTSLAVAVWSSLGSGSAFRAFSMCTPTAIYLLSNNGLISIGTMNQASGYGTGRCRFDGTDACGRGPQWLEPHVAAHGVLCQFLSSVTAVLLAIASDSCWIHGRLGMPMHAQCCACAATA